MHHLEIDMREHIDALYSSVFTEHTDLISIGFSRPVLQKCVLSIIEGVVDRKLKWLCTTANMYALDPADILAELIRSVVKDTANDVGDVDMVPHVDKTYHGFLRTMSESIDAISATVNNLLRKPTWRTVDIRVIGSRAFITLGEDYRIKEYYRLKAFEQEILKIHNTDYDEINVAINSNIERLRGVYSRLPNAKL